MILSYSFRTTLQQLKVVLPLTVMIAMANCTSPSKSMGTASQPVKTLMVGGGSSHDFDRWYKQEDVQTLTSDGTATVTYTSNTDSIIHYLNGMDVLFLANNQPIKDPAVRKAIMDFVNSGKGLVLAHAALWYNWRDWPEYNKQLASGGSRGHDKYGQFNVKVIQQNHPIMTGVPETFLLKDELYYFKADSTAAGINVLAEAYAGETSVRYPSVFTVNHPKARIVGIALGHDAESHSFAPYQKILSNAIRYAANR